MKYYREITLISDAEVPLYFLWTKVYTRLHIAFADQKNKNDAIYAVSFPEYSEKCLGSKIRIMASQEEDLEALALPEVLKTLSDYVHCTGVRPVPERKITGYAVYSRYQPENSVPAKARRYVRRHSGVSYEEAVSLFKRKDPESRFPYITLKSATNSHHYPLFIEKKEAERPEGNEFNTFGLSRHSAVPEF
ncbi:MAG: type I-F CRISPR-associated endoribonuclease Cas6/Csy4 [Pyramidobacter sp.]|jgi:CRISPR-associated endonuclease Csy4